MKQRKQFSIIFHNKIQMENFKLTKAKHDLEVAELRGGQRQLPGWRQEAARWLAGAEGVRGEMGAPLIEGCLARFDCAMHQRVTAGDHDILMGRVIGFSRHEGEALLYHGGAFQRLG